MTPAVRARPWVAVGRRAVAHASMAALLAGSTTAQAPAARPATDAPLAAAARALAAGDLDGALTLGTAYLKQHPRSLRAQLLLVQVHVERDDLDAAYRLAAAVVRAQPGDADALYYLGLVTRRLAAMELARLVQIAPDSARVRQLQAEAFEAQERRADAEGEYAAALEAQPDLIDALLGLARLKRIRLACEEAMALYDRAERIRPTFEGAFGLGICHSYLQNDAVAVERFQEAVTRDPSAAVAWSGLGTALVKLRRTAEGIDKLQRAIALEPGMAEAHYMLGMAYQAAGDRARAQAAFKRADELRAR